MDYKFTQSLKIKFHRLFFPKDNKNDLENQKKEHFIERNSIRLLTYNLFMRPPPIKNN